MTASPELGIEDVNDESGSQAAATAPATEPQEPDQQAAPSTNGGGVQPHDSGAPYVHVVVEEQA